MSTAYHIEFDVLPGHEPGTGATLDNSVLQPSGWRSIGDPAGGRFTNQTGGPLRAIILKTNNSGDIFSITAESAGQLFDTVWLKNDNTQAYFLDGHIPNNNTIPNLAAFWMRVPPNSDSEIEQCDGGGSCPFTGQAFAENPPDPTGPSWVKIKSRRRAANEKWSRLHSACPSVFRDIKAYAESPDGRQVLFVSRGEVLLYDDNSRTVASMTVQETVFSTINRISFENGAFILWKDGRNVRSVHTPKVQFAIIGKTAAPPKLNSFADVKAFLDKFIQTNGTDLSGSPHGDFWNVNYDTFVNGDVRGVPGVKTMVKGDAEHSNLILILRGPITVAGTTYEQMPADGSPFMSSDLIATLADWINRGCPQ